MIRIEKTFITGTEPAIRGMRNPLDSHEKSDDFGPADTELAMKLSALGGPHAKYRRMIVVYADITAPLYWWKEFDTYKVSTVANSNSTMHTIHKKKFTLFDFSFEHLTAENINLLHMVIDNLNWDREEFLRSNNKDNWWQLIQLLPSSYNQLRTVMMNYEVLANIYQYRKNHKLDEWREFCKWIETLPHYKLITGTDTE